MNRFKRLMVFAWLSLFCGTVFAQITISTSSLPSGMETVPYSVQLQATNGVPPYAWSIPSDYTEQSQPNSFTGTVGVAKGWHADDNSWKVTLPFEFPLFGKARTNLYVNSNGTLTFDGFFSQFWVDMNTFKQQEMIAPLLADLSTYSPDDIYVETSSNTVTVRWDGHYTAGGAVNFSATLSKNGQIVLKYGSGNVNGGMIGISAGDGTNYLISAKSESGSMASASDIVFKPVGGLPDQLFFTSMGYISGTPVLPGTSTVTVMVKDSVGATTNRVLEIVIESKPLEITTTSMPSGMEMVPYHKQLEATNGVAPYTWSVPSQVVAWGFEGYGYEGSGNLCDVPAGLSDVIAVDGGYAFSVALKSDGTVVGWGESYRLPPAGLANVTAIAAGDNFGLALKNDGSVTAWGDSYYTSGASDVTDAIAVAAGSYHYLALKPDGTVVAGGANWNGQCDVPAGLSNVVALAAGNSHSLALKSDGTVVGWGQSYSVPTGWSDVIAIASGGSQSLALKSDGTVVGWGGGYSVPTGLSNVLAIACGYNHSLALKSDGTVVAWGWDQYGDTIIPAGLTNVVAIGAGPYHSMAILSDSSVLPKGLTCNASGVVSGTPILAGTNQVTFVVEDALGVTTNKEMEMVIAPNPNLRPMVDATGPSTGTVQMTEPSNATFNVVAHDPESSPLSYQWTWDGAVVGSNSKTYTHIGRWGDAGVHQLRCYISDALWLNSVYAQWDVRIADVPIEIKTTSMPSGMEMVPYSKQLTAAYGKEPYSWSARPQVVAWGFEGYGYEGSGNPCDVPAGLRDVVAVDGGQSFSVALKSDGTVVGWGESYRLPPSGLANVKAIAAGDYFGLALKNDGTVTAWGDHYTAWADDVTDAIAVAAGGSHYLVLRSDGTVIARGENWNGQCDVPEGLSNVVALAAGYSHCLALKSDGTVVGWGDSSSVPTGWSNITAIAAGYYCSLGLKTDGTVVARGGNWNGQCNIPEGLSNVVALVTGGNHSLALKSDGSVVAWGSNNYGETIVPAGLGKVKAIGAGQSHSLVVLSDSSVLPKGLICNTSGVVSGTPTQAGTNHVTFLVVDAQGYATNKIFEITIAPNSNLRPVVDTTHPLAGLFRMQQPSNATFNVAAHDPESSPLSYQWTWDGIMVGSNSKTYTHIGQWGDAGSHTLRCYVSDDLWTNVVYAQWNVVIEQGPPSMLMGIVRGDGLVIADAFVELRDAAGESAYISFTGPDGVYSIPEIRPGSYTIKVGAEGFADEWYDNVTQQTKASSYMISGNTVIGGFNFDLLAGQSPALVEITSDPPGATVYLDYQLTTNVTPVVMNIGEAVMATGSHAISLAGSHTTLLAGSHTTLLAPRTISVKKNGSPYPAPLKIFPAEAECVSAHFDMVSNQVGSITISTVPSGAEVFVDYADQAVGVSPITVGNLAAGSSVHTILIRKEGYLRPAPLEVSALTTTNSVEYVLTAGSGGLTTTVKSFPSGATVYIDYLPTTNVTDCMVGGMDWASHVYGLTEHTTMIRKKGYLPAAPRYLEETNMIHLVVNAEVVLDEDGDGLPDQWEDSYRLRELAPGQNGANDDPDHDGSSNRAEWIAGTNPLKLDTDNDGLNDGREGAYKTDPLKADTDGDGLSDGEEVNKYGTDPLKVDTDGDGYEDGNEIQHGSDPLNPNSVPKKPKAMPWLNLLLD